MRVTLEKTSLSENSFPLFKIDKKLTSFSKLRESYKSLKKDLDKLSKIDQFCVKKIHQDTDQFFKNATSDKLTFDFENIILDPEQFDLDDQFIPSSTLTRYIAYKIIVKNHDNLEKITILAHNKKYPYALIIEKRTSSFSTCPDLL